MVADEASELALEAREEVIDDAFEAIELATDEADEPVSDAAERAWLENELAKEEASAAIEERAADAEEAALAPSEVTELVSELTSAREVEAIARTTMFLSCMFEVGIIRLRRNIMVKIQDCQKNRVYIFLHNDLYDLSLDLGFIELCCPIDPVVHQYVTLSCSGTSI